MSLQARIAAFITAVGTDIKTLLGRALPAGGAAGQVLSKTGAGDYAVGWADAAAGGGGSPAGDDGAVQYKSGTGFGGAANVDIHGGDLTLAVSATRTTPPAGAAKVVIEKLAGLDSLAVLGQNAAVTHLQRSIGRRKIAWWNPTGGTVTAPVVFGMPALSVQGTATARAVSLTNRVTRKTRHGYVSGAAAGSQASQYATWAHYAFGDGAGNGGFHLVYEFAFTDAVTVANARAIVGLRNATTVPGNYNPPQYGPQIGVAHVDSVTDQLHMVVNVNMANNRPSIPLGQDFPIMGPSNTPVPYRLTLTSLPEEEGVIYWRVENLLNGASVSGSDVGADTNILYGPIAWRTNNATAAAVAIDVIDLLVERD